MLTMINDDKLPTLYMRFCVLNFTGINEGFRTLFTLNPHTYIYGFN